MTTRTFADVLTLALVIGGCAPHGGAASVPSGDPESPTTANREAPRTAIPERAIHPSLRARFAEITEDSVASELAWIAGSRETGSAHHDEVAARLEDTLRSLGYTVSRQPVAFGDQRADNIVGERVGTDPSRVILVGAHYDSVAGSPGADDNASGVVATLEAAETLAEIRTEATILVVFFCLEESGLLGSEAFVQAWPRDDSARRLEVAVTLDMVGYSSDEPNSQQWPDGVELLAGGREIPRVGDFAGAFWLTETPFELVSRFEAADDYVTDLRVQTLAIPRVVLDMAPDLLRSDHAPFWRGGLNAISISDTGPFRNPNYHSMSDTVETLDLGFLARVSRWLSAALVSLARIPVGGEADAVGRSPLQQVETP